MQTNRHAAYLFHLHHRPPQRRCDRHGGLLHPVVVHLRLWRGLRPALRAAVSRGRRHLPQLLEQGVRVLRGDAGAQLLERHTVRRELREAELSGGRRGRGRRERAAVCPPEPMRRGV